MSGGLTTSESTYTQLEVHRIDRRGASVRITFEERAITVEVDKNNGQGFVDYVESDSAESACWCQSDVDEAWGRGYKEGLEDGSVHTGDVLQEMHRALPHHWGAAETCYEEPCLEVRTQIERAGF